MREFLQNRLRAPCVYWYWGEDLNELEQLVWGRVKGAGRILDYGAGEARLKKKFLEKGFSGEYDTLDISSEYNHTYQSVEEVIGKYDAIFCFEVIEHMSLNEYVDLMDKFQRHLNPGGMLIVSTPNPLCIVPMWSLDAGHIQQFPLSDIAADFAIRGFDISVYRFKLGKPPTGLASWVRFFIQRILCYFLSVDYAQGLLVIGKFRSSL
jgi:hypothetical protein